MIQVADALLNKDRRPECTPATPRFRTESAAGSTGVTYVAQAVLKDLKDEYLVNKNLGSVLYIGQTYLSLLHQKLTSIVPPFRRTLIAAVVAGLPRPLERCLWEECLCSVQKPAHKLHVCARGIGSLRTAAHTPNTGAFIQMMSASACHMWYSLYNT